MNNIRTQAWRRAQEQRNKGKEQHKPQNLAQYPREKNWKMLYMRSNRLARALQLGMEYPRISNAKLTLKSFEERKEKE